MPGVSEGRSTGEGPRASQEAAILQTLHLPGQVMSGRYGNGMRKGCTSPLAGAT